MRQEVDIRYVVTSLKGSAQHLYENVYCQRGQMENLIKLHKAQLASDRMSCHSATANQVRLVLHTAAFWLMHGVRAAIPQASPLARCEFATIRERLIKIGARVIEHIARIRVQLPTSCPVCAEKLDSNILVMQPTDHGMRHDTADLLDGPRNGGIHVQ